MSEFALKVDPAERAAFSGKAIGTEPVTIPIKVTNPGKERIAYKVKCTSNEIFRIRPPVGFLKSGDTCVVQLTFNAGKSPPENNKHYVAIYYIKAEDEKKTTARQAWSEHKGEPAGTKRIYIDFKKEDGAAKEDDKKDDKKEDKKEDKEEKKEDKKEEKDDKKEDDKKDEKDDKKDDDKKDDKKDDDKKDEKDEKKDDDKKDDEKKDDDKKDDEKKE